MVAGGVLEEAEQNPGDGAPAGLTRAAPGDDGLERSGTGSDEPAASKGVVTDAPACRKSGLASPPPAATGATLACSPAPRQAGWNGGGAICAIAVHELNEEAIELIFTFLPAEDRRSAAAVCRLWRRVHNSSTKLWGSVLLSGERIVQAAASTSAGAILSWLSARLEAMRSVRLWSPSLPLEAFASGLAQLLSSQNRLHSFSYVASDASVSRLLGELQGLTSLQLLDILAPALAPGQGLVVRARELAKLKPLRNLLSLQLHASEIRGSLPPALFRCLNRLQHLTISARCRLPAAVVRQLTGLRSLELHGASMDAAAAEAAAALQRLTQLAISVQGREAAQEGGGGGGGEGEARRGGAAAPRWQDHAIWGHLPRLTSLQQLWVGADLPGGGGGATLLPYAALEGSVPDGIMDCAALTHLVLPVALTSLPELVPGQLAGLAVLDLTHSLVEALPPCWCLHLRRLRRLSLNGAAGAGGALPPQFSALRSLRHLEMRACRLAALPAAVAALPGLTHLDLGLNRLEGLPPGPYLAALRTLSLRGNALRALPAALADAPLLEVLDAGENDGLALRPDDVHGLLGRLPALRHLVLSRQPADGGFGPYISASTGAAWDVQSVAVLMQLARALPHLAVHLERGEAPPCGAAPPTPQPDSPAQRPA